MTKQKSPQYLGDQVRSAGERSGPIFTLVDARSTTGVKETLARTLLHKLVCAKL